MSDSRVIFKVTPHQIGRHVVVFRYVEHIENNQRNFFTEVHRVYRFKSLFRAMLCTKRFARNHNRCYKVNETRDFLALIVMLIARSRHNRLANHLP